MPRLNRRRAALLFQATVLALMAGGFAVRVNPATERPAPALRLLVRYPGPGQRLPYVEKEFIFGYVTPGSRVDVNGSPALVAPSGGWIAYVPVSAGRFQFRVTAANSAHRAEVVREVDVANPLVTTPATPARVDAAVSAGPEHDVELRVGDSLPLFVKASADARVVAQVVGSDVAVPMAAVTAQSFEPTEMQRILGGLSPSGPVVGGLYEGRLTLSAALPPVFQVRYVVTARDASTASVVAAGHVHVRAEGYYRVGRIILEDRRKNIDARPYGIVESEPDGGWLFYPPPGTPFEVTGSMGDDDRVALGAGSGWIRKKSLALQPPGTAAPRALVAGVEVKDGAQAARVLIHLSRRVPFSISEDADTPSLRVRFYGATAGNDFVAYGADRSNIETVGWDQEQPLVVAVTMTLRQPVLWGYHAGWCGRDLEITVRKLPHFAPPPASALTGLRIVIDPGHSPDTGAIGPLGTQERDVNLAIAKRLAHRLQRLGARTELTRSSNVPVGLYDRTALASRLGADVLISLHNNALPDGVNPFTHHGFSVYYYQAQSLALARALHDAYGRDTDLPDYGLYYDNLALTRPTEEVAVLTESAFIMWPPEEMDLRSAAFQERLAATLADGLQRWAASVRAAVGR